jgi:hypothetical protein
VAQIYSQRNRPQPNQLRYDLPNEVRRRLFTTIQQAGADYDPEYENDALLNQLGRKLVKQYGGLCAPAYEAARQSTNPVIEHFLSCDDGMALDYIEFWFQCPGYARSGRRAVEDLNDVLRECGIGYDLSPWVNKETVRPKSMSAMFAMAGVEPEVIAYPQFIQRDSQFTHATVVKPCLDVLTNPSLTQANKELLGAFAKYRHGDFDGAITSCGAAFESVLKTICDRKNWKYDRDKDALARLVDTCYQNNLFPSFYVEVFKQVGTVRNKLGDAHGRGPAPAYTVSQEHVEHLIQFVAAHIVLLAKLSGI